ncbi:MAG: hypothetical protein QM695_02070 [Micropruina sp.]
MHCLAALRLAGFQLSVTRAGFDTNTQHFGTAADEKGRCYRVSTKANVKTTVPETSKRVPATRVTVRLRMSESVTVPITVHMFLRRRNVWRWSLSKSGLAHCRK